MIQITFVLLAVLSGLVVMAEADGKMATPQPAVFLKSLIGKWEGTCKTWFEPGKLADESKVKGEIAQILDGGMLRHTYTGEMMKEPRKGEETVVFDKGRQAYQISWFDTFHMADGILFSEGSAIKNGFAVTGSYRMAPDQPEWGWRTEYELIDADHLTITAYNIMPDGTEGKAVETVYTRVKAAQ